MEEKEELQNWRHWARECGAYGTDDEMRRWIDQRLEDLEQEVEDLKWLLEIAGSRTR